MALYEELFQPTSRHTKATQNELLLCAVSIGVALGPTQGRMFEVPFCPVMGTICYSMFPTSLHANITNFGGRTLTGIRLSTSFHSVAEMGERQLIPCSHSVPAIRTANLSLGHPIQSGAGELDVQPYDWARNRGYPGPATEGIHWQKVTYIRVWYFSKLTSIFCLPI